MINLPIKRGTARRLGIRRPDLPAPWLIDMMRNVELLGRKLDAIGRAYSGGDGRAWRACCRAGRQVYPKPCPWHPS